MRCAGIFLSLCLCHFLGNWSLGCWFLSRWHVRKWVETTLLYRRPMMIRARAPAVTKKASYFIFLVYLTASKANAGDLNLLSVSEFLSMFLKFRKATISGSCLSVYLSIRQSVHPRGTTRFPISGFSWNLLFEYFLKIKILLKYDKNNGYFYIKTKTHLWSHLAHIF